MKWNKAGILFALAFAAATAAGAMEQGAAAGGRAFAAAYGQTLPPIGYVEFCRRGPESCEIGTRGVRRAELTPERWNELVSVNDYVNRRIAPVTDIEFYGAEDYWTLPDNAGDCEDYVLLKQKYLVELGWAASTLLITVVLDENNDGHAVLTVVTDRGEFVLDNQDPEILAWHRTPYHFIKRQSAESPHRWVSLDPAITSAPAVAGRRNR